MYDSQVLVDVVQNQGFVVPEKFYFLANTGYLNSDYIMIPDQGIWYYLKKQNLVAEKLENAKKLFNLHYLSL